MVEFGDRYDAPPALRNVLKLKKTAQGGAKVSFHTVLLDYSIFVCRKV